MNKLNQDALRILFFKLSLQDYVKMRLVCKRFKNIIDDEVTEKLAYDIEKSPFLKHHRQTWGLRNELSYTTLGNQMRHGYQELRSDGMLTMRMTFRFGERADRLVRFAGHQLETAFDECGQPVKFCFSNNTE